MVSTECRQCGIKFLSHSAWIKNGRGIFCSKACHNKSMAGPTVVYHTFGYRMLKMKSHHAANKRGFVYEHRIVMEKKIGRWLTSSDVVHHINHDPSDNRPENLQLTTLSEHAADHQRERLVLRGVVDPINYKICHKCKSIKKRDEFSPSCSRGKPQLASKCRVCAKEYQREFRKTDKYREWRKNNNL